MSEGKTYTEHLQFVEQKLDKLADSFDQFAKDQKSETQSIKQLLAGSEFGEDGLISKVMKQDQRIEKLEDFKQKNDDLEQLKTDVQTLKEFKSKLIGYALGTGFASGGVTAGIISLFT